MESKRPLTRRVLEARISETQTLIDDAVAKKDFSECAPLQAKLDSLIAKRKDLPTFEELKEAIKLAEKDVADAAARRDFKGAALYQASAPSRYHCAIFSPRIFPYYCFGII